MSVVEILSPPLLTTPIDCSEIPPSLMRYRVYRECGCAVWCGVRYDRRPPEAMTLGVPCRTEHRPLIERFNDLMRWSLVGGGTDRPLVDVVAELLDEAVVEAVA